MKLYQAAIAQEFTTSGRSRFDSSEVLYSRVYYFHQERQVADADNISKPIVDALSGKAYDDDKQVIFRSAACFDMRRDFQIDFTKVPSDLVADISRAILNGEPVIYVEVGRYSNDFLKFGV